MSSNQLDIQPMPMSASSAWASPITQGVCLAAVYWASRQALKNWIAASSLTPTPLPEDFTPPVRTGSKKIFNKDNVRFIPMVALFFFYIFAFVGLPMIKSKSFLDGICITVMSIIIMTGYYMAIGTFHSTNTVSYRTVEVAGKHSRHINHSFDKGNLNRCLALACLIGTLFSCAHGYSIGFATAAGSFAVMMVAFLNLPKVTTRHMILALNGYIVFVLLGSFIVVGVIMALVALFDSKDDASKDPSNSDSPMPVPSPWVLQLSSLSYASIPMAAPGALLALALRFDYSRTIQLGYKAEAGVAVAAPKSLVSFPKPTFNAGFVALTLCVAGWSIAKAYLPMIPDSMDMFLVFFSIPITTVTLALSAWSRGQLRAWWMYSETWAPGRDDATNAKTASAAEEAGDVAPATESEKLLGDESA